METSTSQYPRTESAWEWFQRSQRAKAAPPTDAAAAAWAFCRGGTGIAFVDVALKRSPDTLPVIDIRGQKGKTLTAISLAARYVVATRSSQYTTDNNNDDNDQMAAPHAFVMDSGFDIVISRLVHIVRSTLLRKITGSCDEGQVQTDLEDCLRRIHLVTTADGMAGWVPRLELLRHRLKSLNYPTLIVWDGFLSEPESNDEASRMEVIRQVERILLTSTALFVTTTRRRREWERFITQRIHLDDSNAAIIAGTRVPFQMSLSGMLT